MNYGAIVMNKIKAPSFLIKLAVISIVFIYAIDIEMGLLIEYSKSLTGKNKLNFLIFITHMFSYFELYSKYFLVALIILIPDILDEPYLTTHIFLSNKNRNKLFRNTISLIMTYILLFICWFIFLALVMSLFRIRIFNFSWPSDFMNGIYGSVGLNQMALVSIPKSATEYPLIISSILVFIRVFIGFFIIALISFLVSFRKKNVSYGVGIAVIIYIVSDLLFYNGQVSWNIFSTKENLFSLAPFAYKYSMCAFFTFENIGLDFMHRILHTYAYGSIIIIILLALIKREINNNDLI